MQKGQAKALLFFISIVSLLCSCTGSNDNGQSEALLTVKADSLPKLVDYNIHVRPILSDKCFNCHGPDKNKREAGLRLDNADAYNKIDGHFAIVPKHPERSEAMARIFSDDSEKKMPLPSSNLSLTDLEKAIIAKWIKQGAVYKPHWAFIKPETLNIPVVKQKGWVKNPIDNFILSKIEKEGLKPSAAATKEKLARRLYIDLTGLPPTMAQIDSFLKDNTSKAYANLVDKLLSKPQYGERMTNEWMDVARYADSHGYQDDGESEMWPWRDWVIKAFNQNMPYDKFITWQMAGDLLPNATKEQILATGFHRNHMINAEGGIIDEEFRTEYVLDRVNTTGKAFLALTVECSRCHDHKYDPISQKEFYQMSAFFNQLEEPGKGNLYENSTGPTMLLTDEKTEEQLKYIREKIKSQEQKLKDYAKNQSEKPKIGAQIDAEFNKNLVAYFNFETSKPKDSTIYNLVQKENSGKLSKTIRFEKGYKGNGLFIDGDERTDFANQMYNFERNEPFSASLFFKTPKYSEKGFTLLANCAATYHGFRGYELLLIKNKIHVRITNSWPSNALQAVSVDSVSPKQWHHVAFSYDGSSRGEGINIFINGKKVKTEITHNNLFRTIKTHTVAEDRNALETLEKIEKKRPLTLKEVKLKRQLGFRAQYSKPHMFSIGGRRDAGTPPFFDGLIDEVKVYSKALTEAEVAADFTGKPLSEIIASNKYDTKTLYLDYFDAQWKQEMDNLKALRAHENNLILPLREIKVMQDKPQKRETFVLNRGNYDAPTDKVEEGAIEAVLPYSNYPKNRLGLAQWLTDKDNPLTARVVVNRYWQMIFGTGLVTTSADFGNQGNMPTHPELLDWLTLDFVNSGWDVKRLIKMMVMSATYQQTSAISKELLAIDPQNMLYARGSRYRYPYEVIRDNALVASGLINYKIGGESFKPYQPVGLWEEKTESPVNNYYEVSKAPEIYRRSMYIFLKRTSPHPAFSAFDGPERFACQVKRQSTNTPIQALTSLNDPQFMEAARVLAQNELATNTSMKQKIASIFQKIVTRKPTEKELAVLGMVYENEKSKFAKNPKKAEKILNSGLYPQNVKLSKTDVAALAMVAHTVMNLDEAVSRE